MIPTEIDKRHKKELEVIESCRMLLDLKSEYMAEGGPDLAKTLELMRLFGDMFQTMAKMDQADLIQNSVCHSHSQSNPEPSSRSAATAPSGM